MNEHLFVKGQRVITPQGDGEVIDAIGDGIRVKAGQRGSEILPFGRPGR